MRRPHPKYPNRADDREDAVDFLSDFGTRTFQELPLKIRDHEQQAQTLTDCSAISLRGRSKKNNLLLVEAFHHSNIPMLLEKASGWSKKSIGILMPTKSKSDEERRTMRSKTFPGMASDGTSMDQ